MKKEVQEQHPYTSSRNTAVELEAIAKGRNELAAAVIINRKF